MRDYILKRQLKAEGASRREAEELSKLAGRLDRMPVPHLSREAKAGIARDLGIRPHGRPLEMRLVFSGAMAALLAVVIVSQHASPSSPLYEVRQLTDFFHSQPSSRPAYHPSGLPQTRKPLAPIAQPQSSSSSSGSQIPGNSARNPDGDDAQQANGRASVAPSRPKYAPISQPQGSTGSSSGATSGQNQQQGDKEGLKDVLENTTNLLLKQL